MRCTILAAGTNRRIGRAFVVALLLALVAGCGRNATGEVSGKVTFKGKPIAFGTIAFLGPQGKVASGTIVDGAYSVAGVPVGPATVTVQAHQTPPQLLPPDGSIPEGEPAKPQGPFVVIPARYADPEESGLSYEVVPGRQTHDLALQP